MGTPLERKIYIYKDTKLIHKMLRDGKLELKFDDKIAALPTEIERFEKLHEYLKPYLEQACEKDENEKNDITAIFYREEAEVFYNEGSREDALIQFTKSIAYAATLEERAIGYARRADILLYWRMIEEYKVDMARSIECNSMEIWRNYINRGLERAKNFKPLDVEYHTETPTIKDTERNKKIECAANSIKMETNKKFGRHIVATRDINIGEVVMIEKPFVFAIENDDVAHCYECYVLCYNPIPCDACTEVLYCSEDCKVKAQDFHKYECVVRRKIDPCDLSDEIIVALKLTYLMRNRHHTTEDFNTNDKVYRSDRYAEVYNLNQSYGDMENARIVQLMLYNGVFIYHILKNFTDYFDVDNPEAAEKEFKRLIVKNRAIIGRNFNNVVETAKIYGETCGLVVIGSGIYPAMQLFNHACCNNILPVSFGTTFVFYAVRTIKKGEQCFLTYSVYRYEDLPKFARQQILSTNFKFRCTCKACVEDWPLTTTRGFDNGRNISAYRLFRSCEMKYIQNHLKVCIKNLKAAEKTAPSEDFIIACQVLDLCLRSFGNVRPIGTTVKRTGRSR